MTDPNTNHPADAPPVDEQTGQQAVMIPGLPGVISPAGAFLGGNAGLFPNGYNAGLDPYSFGRWAGRMYWGTYTAYRLMLAHGRIRQARATLTSPILGSVWEYSLADGAPEEIKAFVKEQFDPLRRQYVSDALRAIDYGWAGFEVIWAQKDGDFRIARLKPLMPDITTIRVDPRGNFIGLLQGPTIQIPADGSADNDGKPGGILRADEYKAHLYTFDRECGNLYGRSMLENCRETSWRMWLDSAFQLHGIGEKLSQVIAMGFAPAGTYSDGKGGTVTPLDVMKHALQGLKDTGMAVFSNLVAMAKPGASAEELQKMSQAALSSIQFYDAGSHSAAIAGELERMKHAEDLMFAGYLLSSRTGMQSENGSRADSEQHSDTGLMTSELIDDDIADQLQPLVDATVTLKFGDQYAGACRIKPAPLVDNKTGIYEKILEAGLADPSIGSELSASIDWPAVFAQLDIATAQGSDVAQGVKVALDQKRKNAAAPPPPTGEPLQVKARRTGKTDATGVMLSRWIGAETPGEK